MKNCINQKNFGFTLAEILITLGIIGVVAAMTIPTLINHYNKKITETRLAKFYSLFNQAIRLSVAENGEVEGWTEYWDTSNDVEEDENGNDQLEAINNAFKKYLMPYMKIMYTKNVRYRNQNNTLYVLADGSAFSYRGENNRDISFYPKNAEKCIERNEKPGICAFRFLFYPLSNNINYKYHTNTGLEPLMYSWNGDKAKLYRGDSTYSCEDSGLFCAALIKQNGWKIPSDYPHKIRY